MILFKSYLVKYILYIFNYFCLFNFKKLVRINFSEIGQHFYWSIFGFQVHGQVLINSWIVIAIILFFSIFTTSDLKRIPEDRQTFVEFFTDFIRDIAKTQIGEKEYLKWVPYLGTIFIFIFVSNWSGALIPWKIIELPNGELGAPTNDMYVVK